MENPSKNPFRVMINPRGFMKSLTAGKPSRGWWIAGLVGLSWLFAEAYAFSMGYQALIWGILLFVFVCAIPVGYLIVYVSTFLLYWIGKIFNGKASFDMIYQAFLWSRVPELFIALSWIGLVAIYGQAAFTPEIMYGQYVPMIVMLLFIIQVIFSIWETVILFHTLGEVQGFSAWIAIWNVLFVWVILMVIEGSFHWVLAKGLSVNPLAIKSLFII